MWNPKNVVFVCCCFSILILKSCFAGHHVLGAKSREMESFEKNLLNTLEVYFDLEKDCMYDLTYYLYHSNKESNNLYIT